MVEYCNSVLIKKTDEATIITCLSKQLAMLRTLSVRGCIITDRGTELIMEVLTKTILLHKFDMSESMVDTVKAAAIIRVFALSKNAIKSFNISRNCITADGIENVASALAQCRTLEELNMSHNSLNFTGIVKIAESLRGHQTLQSLNLSNNLPSFHSEGEFLVDVISTNKSLIYVNICGRNIRPRFTNDLLFPPPSIDSGLSTRFPLQNLYLSRLPTFDMFTFKSAIIDVPNKFIKATTEPCPIFDQTIVSYYVDHDGGTFYNPEHDFGIVVPPGAVLQGECVEIKATASHFGPYQFPNGYHPVSSFFWASSNYTFKIPVYLIMSHYAVIKNIDDIKSLCVLQACTRDLSITDDGNLIMKEVLSGVYFDSETRYCILAIQHFCSFSVQEKSEGRLSKKFKVLCYDYKYNSESNDEQYITEVCFCPNSCDCSKVSSIYVTGWLIMSHTYVDTYTCAKLADECLVYPNF